MTKRSQLKDHLYTLEEIGNIMTAMKNLCSIEMNKTTKFLLMQERVMKTIQEVSSDFLSFFPIFPRPKIDATPVIYILIGSERGFCGGFNDYVVNQLASLKEQSTDFNPALIIVGRKLALKLANDSRVMATLDGPNALEEIPTVILKILQSLEDVSSRRHIDLHSWQWGIIFNEEEQNQIQTKMLQPFKEFGLNKDIHFSVSPILTLPHDLFLAEFVDNYLFAMFHSIFYKSFYAENHQRFFHLSNSLDRLDSKQNTLKGYLNLLRQEEITEEIQIIMLSAEAVIGRN